MCLETLSADIKIVDSIQYKTFQKRGGRKMGSLVYVPDPVAAILLDLITEEEWVRVEIGTLGVGVGVSTSRSLAEFNMEVIKTPAMQPG